MNNNAIVITNGCPENRIDSAEIEQCLIHNGWMVTQEVNQADLIILNLCGLLNENVAKSLNLVKQMEKIKKTNAKLIVTGCLPKINNSAIKSIFWGDIVKGHNISGILESLNVNKLSNDYTGNYLIPTSNAVEPKINKIYRKLKNSFSLYAVLNHFYFKEYRKYWEQINIVQPDTFYIKVCSGCMNACSYCAVKLSRGTVKSKLIEEIKQEFLVGLKAGYTHFSLIGTDLGSYGKDIQTDLPDLLKQLVFLEGKFNISLRNVHPQLLISQLPEMIKLVKSGKINHITTAVQHGNDRILKLMKRHYAIKDFTFAVNTIKQHCKNLKIRTQIIVGFPGETQKAFEDTLRLIGSINVDFFEVYPYSPRMGTSAAKIKHQNTINTICKREYIARKRVVTFLGSIDDGRCYRKSVGLYPYR